MNTLKIIVIGTIIMSLGILGCAQKPESANSSEAIKQAKTLESTEAQAQYLIKEANAFINSQQFDEAIKSAKYVLSKLDSDSSDAKDIIEKAKTQLEKLAKQKAEELKGEVSKKLSSLGQ